MTDVLEIETALRQLPSSEKWQIARWLLEDLEENGHKQADPHTSPAPVSVPDYAARRRRIFGEKVLPNLVLTAREEERW
jgi:hypothetical protein